MFLLWPSLKSWSHLLGPILFSDPAFTLSLRQQFWSPVLWPPAPASRTPGQSSPWGLVLFTIWDLSVRTTLGLAEACPPPSLPPRDGVKRKQGIGPRWQNAEDIHGDLLNLLLKCRSPGQRAPVSLKTLCWVKSWHKRTMTVWFHVDGVSRADTVTEKVGLRLLGRGVGMGSYCFMGTVCLGWWKGFGNR